MERSLQLARRKDLEDDIPRRNSSGPYVSGNGNETQNVHTTVSKQQILLAVQCLMQCLMQN